MKLSVYIQEKSWLARYAAWHLRADNCAIVFGSTVYLHGVTKKAFLEHHRWVRHEVAHVLQYQRDGFLLFLLKYAYFSIRYGYKKNPYELEAQAAETNEEILQGVVLV